MNNKAFSSIDLVGQCLIDKERTLAFKEAIDSLCGGALVIDVGTGSGVLAMLAKKAGARKVLAVEFDPFIANTARENFAANDMSDQIILIEDNAETFDPTKYLEQNEKIDIVLMELITTGMIDEAQVASISNLKNKGVLSDGVIFIPSVQETYATLIQFDPVFYGLKFPMPIHAWQIHESDLTKFTRISEKKIIDAYDFSKKTETELDKELVIPVKISGKANAVMLESTSRLSDNISIGETSAINGKVILPIDEGVVNVGDQVHISIKYKYGNGFESLKIKRLC